MPCVRSAEFDVVERYLMMVDLSSKVVMMVNPSALFLFATTLLDYLPLFCRLQRGRARMIEITKIV